MKCLIVLSFIDISKVIDWITAKDEKEQDEMIKNAIKQGSMDEKRAKLEQESRRKKRRRTVE